MKKKIFAVDINDQSIYITGAEIKNFLTFDKIYKNCRVFKLEIKLQIYKKHMKQRQI